MNANEYKMLTASPNTFRKSEIEAISNLLNKTDVKLKNEFVSSSNCEIPRPPLHNNSPWESFFYLNMSQDQTDKLVSLLVDAEVAAVSYDGETTAEASAWADLVNRMLQYQAWLESKASLTTQSR